MRALLPVPLALAACLDAPPASLHDGGPGAGDGGTSCPAEIGLPFTSEGDIAGWTPETGEDCTYAITGVGLEFRNTGTASNCRLYADAQLDMRGGALQVRLNDADANLNMSMSLVLGPSGQSFGNRRWLYFERDESELRFGECRPGVQCEDTTFGSIPYSPTTHVYLRFTHDPDNGRVLFETSDAGDAWTEQSAAPGVTFEDLYCLGIDLGSYEDAASDVDSTSSFADLIGAPTPVTLR